MSRLPRMLSCVQSYKNHCDAPSHFQASSPFFFFFSSFFLFFFFFLLRRYQISTLGTIRENSTIVWLYWLYLKSDCGINWQRPRTSISLVFVCFTMCTIVGICHLFWDTCKICIPHHSNNSDFMPHGVICEEDSFISNGSQFRLAESLLLDTQITVQRDGSVIPWAFVDTHTPSFYYFIIRVDFVCL